MCFYGFLMDSIFVVSVDSLCLNAVVIAAVRSAPTAKFMVHSTRLGSSLLIKHKNTSHDAARRLSVI